MTNTTTETNEARDERLKTIIDQINASNFWARARWGVKQLLALGPDEKGVQFNCTKGIKIRIVLDPSDTYSVEIGRQRGLKYTKHYETSDVYADVLVQVIDRAFSNAFGSL